MEKNYKIVESDPRTGNIYCPISITPTIDSSLPIGNKISNIAEKNYLPDSERFYSKFVQEAADCLAKTKVPWFIHIEDDCTGSLQYGTLSFIEESELQVLTFLIEI